VSFVGGILARARRHLGRLRLTFGLGPSGGTPVVPPRPGCLHLTHGPVAEMDLRVEATATLDITMTKTAELSIRIEKC
jgi:hypothetical protein